MNKKNLVEIKKGEQGTGLLIEHDGYISSDCGDNKKLFEDINGGRTDSEFYCPEHFIVSAVFQKYGIENANGRIYPESVLRREVDKYMNKIREKNAIGECYKPSAMILTETGWKHLCEVEIGENILTLNPSTKEIELKPIRNIIRHGHDGNLIHIQGRSIDELVTPGHSFPTFDRNNNFKKFVTAEDIHSGEVDSHSYIPKTGNKELRPLGIPSYEDKLVQAKVAQILNVICERYFKDFSYGFRPNRDCHQAIKRIDEIIMRGNIKTIVEADIKGFFDHVDHDLLIRMLEVIIKDRDFIWLIKRFLKAGYMYQGKYNETDEGTPQGGLISPVLANLYLHVVLDNWFDNEVKTLCQGNAYIVRYADDFVCMFQNEKDAEMFYRMLIKRFDQFKLEVEPTKTKIFSFGRNSKENNTFDFLGFTITNGKTRQGYYRVDYNTSAKKSKLKFKGISDFIKQNIQLGYKELIKQLNRKLIGLYNYYGISGNFCWINKLYNFVKNILRKALGKRSQRGEISWSKLKNILEYNPLIKPEIKYRIW